MGLNNIMNEESGIYKITNTINDNIYIGSAVNLRARQHVHMCDFRKNKHSNIYMQRVFNKYGNIFEFDVLLTCPKSELIRIEQYFINNYQPQYNILKTAGSTLGFKRSEESKKAQSERMKGNQLHKFVKNRPNLKNHDMNNGFRVLQYDVDGNLICEHRSMLQARKAMKCRVTTIKEACLNESLLFGFIWKFKNKNHGA